MDDLPVNWALVDLMGLDIETTRVPGFDKIYLKYRIMKEIAGLVRRIGSMRQRGYLCYDYASHFPDLIASETEDVREYISHELMALGYRVTHVEKLRTCMCIVWVSRYMIIEWKTDENGSIRYRPISHHE